MSSRLLSFSAVLLLTILSSEAQASVLFVDDFNDGVRDPAWTYRGQWAERGGVLAGERSGGQALASHFTGCAANTFIEADMRLARRGTDPAAGGGARLALLGWYADSRNYVELAMKEPTNTWLIKQYVGGRVKATRKRRVAAIDPNISYHARITFDGATFQVFIGGNLIISMPKAAGSTPAGSVGFRTQSAAGHFDNLGVETLEGPIISVLEDITVNEGNSGTTDAAFTVMLSSTSLYPVTVHYETADGTAGPWDYSPVSGDLTIPAGSTERTVTVQVVGDTVGESDEDFFLNISDPSRGSIGDAQGMCTILSEEPLCGSITITPTTLPGGTTGSAYGPVTFSQSGGAPPIVWNLASGTLPSGMSFSAAGTLSGTPTQSGSFPLIVRATDSNGCSGTRSVSLDISCPGLSINPASLADGVRGTAYGPVSFTLTGGSAPVSWDLAAGSLPNGMTFTAAGVLSGTPTQSGSFNITFRGSDSSSCIATQAITLQINQAPQITSANNTAFSVGSAGSFTVTATGMPSPTFSATGVPGWASFSTTTGVLSGTPPSVSPSSYSITFTAMNGVAPNDVQSFTLNITEAPVFTSASSTTFTVGQAGSFTVTASGTPAPTFLASGLPGWASFNTSSGLLSGTPPNNTGSPFAIVFTAQNGVTPDATQNFTLTVSQPAPTAVGDTANAAGNILISVPAPGVLGNDTLNSATISAFDSTSTQGGNVNVSSDGSYTYNPPAGYEGSDTFTYTLTNGGGSSTATVTVTISGMIWFVDSSAVSSGDGRLTTPFNTLAAFQAVNDGTGNHPAANESVFLYERATDYVGPVTLLGGQRLIGQDATASLSVISGVTPPANSMALPSMNSGNGTITNITSASDAIVLGSGNTVRGLTVGNRPNGTGIRGTNVGTLTMNDLTINGTGAALFADTGTLNATIGSIASTSTAGGRAGIDLRSAAGTLTVSGTTAISNPSGAAVSLNTNTGTFSLGAVTLSTNNTIGISSTNGGALNVAGGSVTTTGAAALGIDNTALGISLASLIVTNGAGRGVSLQSNTGSVTIANLQSTTTSGEGVFLSSAGTFSTTTGSIGTTSSPAVLATSTNLNVTLSSASSTNSSAAGISLNTATGTFSVGGGAIVGSAGTAFYVSGGSATISYSGTVNKSSAGRLLEVLNTTGGSVSFPVGGLTATLSSTGVQIANSAANVTIAHLDAGSSGSRLSGTAVNLSNNSGTYAFADTQIYSTAGTGLMVTSSGTLNFTGAGNIIDSTSGTALNIAGTTLGMTLESVSSTNATNGIVLSTSGGSFSVTGTGTTDGSGGTLSNISNNGISLANAGTVSLANMTLTNANTSDGLGCSFADNSGCYGAINLNVVSALVLTNIDISGSAQTAINGRNVANFQLVNSTINNSGTTAEEDGVDIRGLTGTCVIQNSTISNSGGRNVLIRNSSGTLTSLTVSGSTFNGTSAGSGSDGFYLDLTSGGSATATLDVSNSTFTNSRTDGLQVNNEGSGLATVNVTTSSFTSNDAGVRLTGNGTGGGDMSFDISNNTTFNSAHQCVDVYNGGDNANMNFTGRINNNTMQSNAGSAIALWVIVEGNGTGNIEIVGNSITKYDDAGIDVESRGGSGNLQAEVRNNTISGSGANGFAAVFLRSGNGTPGETNTLCVNLSGNNASTAGASFPLGDYVLDRFSSPSTVFNIQGLSPTPVTLGSGGTSNSVATYVSSTDAVGGKTTYVEAGVYSANNCTTP